MHKPKAVHLEETSQCQKLSCSFLPFLFLFVAVLSEKTAPSHSHLRLQCERERRRGDITVAAEPQLERMSHRALTSPQIFILSVSESMTTALRISSVLYSDDVVAWWGSQGQWWTGWPIHGRGSWVRSSNLSIYRSVYVHIWSWTLERNKKSLPRRVSDTISVSV